MKQCVACKKEIADDAMFCSHCGAKVVVETTRKCPKCGEAVEARAKYCPKCGYELSDTLKKFLNFDLENVDPDSKLGRKLQKIEEIDWSSGAAGFLLKAFVLIVVLGLSSLVFWGGWKLVRWIMASCGMS